MVLEKKKKKRLVCMKKSLVRMSPVLKEVVVGDGVGGHFHDRQQKHSLGQTQRGDTIRSQLCMSPGQQITISMLTAPHATLHLGPTNTPGTTQAIAGDSEIRRQRFRVKEKKNKKGKDSFWFIITWVLFLSFSKSFLICRDLETLQYDV